MFAKNKNSVKSLRFYKTRALETKIALFVFPHYYNYGGLLSPSRRPNKLISLSFVITIGLIISTVIINNNPGQTILAILTILSFLTFIGLNSLARISFADWRDRIRMDYEKGIIDTEKNLAIAAEKAGMDPDAAIAYYRETMALYHSEIRKTNPDF